VRAPLALLEVLTEEEWAREGTHSESGRYSVTDWLRIYPATATTTPSRSAAPGGPEGS
jgi:hypothetical protein